MFNNQIIVSVFLAASALIACGSKEKSKPTKPVTQPSQTSQGAPTVPGQPIYTPPPINQYPTQTMPIPGGKGGVPPVYQTPGYPTPGYPNTVGKDGLPVGYPSAGKDYIPNPGQACPTGYYCNTPNRGIMTGSVLGSFYTSDDVVSCMNQAIGRGIPVSGAWPIFDGGVQGGALGYGGNLGYTISGGNIGMQYPHVVMLNVMNFLNVGNVQLNNPFAVYCVKQTNILSSVTYGACNPASVIVYKNNAWLGINAQAIPGCGAY